jgi:preprotein translocase subunit YajC
MTELTVGDLVTAGGCGGRVTAIRGTNVGVEFDDRPKGMGQRVEVRPICEHATLADLCEECAKEGFKA